MYQPQLFKYNINMCSCICCVNVCLNVCLYTKFHKLQINPPPSKKKNNCLKHVSPRCVNKSSLMCSLSIG